MTKTVTRMIASVAALGLVATPIVAQANTRAGDSAVTYSTSNAGPGLGREADGEGQTGGFGFILPILTFTAIILGVGIATGVIGEDQDNCASPPC